MKTSIRTGIIEIDTIKSNEPVWITANIQKLEVSEDGKILSESVRDGKLYRRADKVALELVEFIDPVTQTKHQLSVVGVSLAIKALMVKWMLEDNPEAYYDLENDLVVLDASS